MKFTAKLYRPLLYILMLSCSTALAQNEITNVTMVTTNVIQFKKVEFSVNMEVAFSNPYDAAEIKLDLIIETPSRQTLVVPCFYESGTSISLWGARFTPREAGTYHYHFALEKAGVVVATTTAAEFSAEASASDGFINKGTNWTFQFDSGKPFRGVGQNIGWEGRTWENENYNYEYFLTQLKINGGNLFRTWMGAWNLPLEWKTVVDTWRYQNSADYFHKGGIERMDYLVDLCDSLGLHIMLALDWHGALQTGDRWNINPYNAANGGPANTPTEFFTKAESQAKYKNRLRYLVARWGYSPSIAAWEFFNEIDNSVYNGTESTIAIPHQAVTDWHQQMGAYLKEIDPYDHLVTTSISHREISGLFNLSELDFVQRHLYRVTGNIPSTIQNNTNTFGKPFVVGEFGYDWDWNNINSANGANLDYDYKRGLWYGLFSNTPILPLSWWWEFFDQRNTDSYFKGVREISDRMLRAGNGEFSKVGVTPSGEGLEALAVTCGGRYFIYLLNNRSEAVSGRGIVVPMANGTYALKLFNPETLVDSIMDEVAVDNGQLSLTSLSFEKRESLILIASETGSDPDAQAPYEEAATLPGIVQAEHFDLGGEELAYHDLDATNNGIDFRSEEGVDIGNDGDQVFVTDVVSGEWLEYAVDIQQAGLYSVDLIYSTQSETGAVGLELAGSATGFELNITNNTFDTLSTTLSILETGVQTLRLSLEGSGLNVDQIDFGLVNRAPVVAILSPENNTVFESGETVSIWAEASDEDGSVALVEFFVDGEKTGEDNTEPFTFDWPGVSGSHSIHATVKDDQGLSITSDAVQIEVNRSLVQTPFPDANVPHPIPGKIEAENFDDGEAEVAFHDLSGGNIKGQYRTNVEPDIEVCTDNGAGYNLADIQNGEWVEYTVNVATASHYDFTFRVATIMDAQKFSMAIDDQPLSSNIAVPNTGGWQTWQDISVQGISLAAGAHVIRFTFGSEYFNLNYFDVAEAAPVAVGEGIETSATIYPNPVSGAFKVQLKQPARQIAMSDLQGRAVFEKTCGNELSVRVENVFSAGVYLLNVSYQSGVSEILRVVVLP